MSKDKREDLRFAELSFFDLTMRRKGYKYVAGIDEAGRGPLAGPVVAAACILPLRKSAFVGIDDSKQLTPARRAALFQNLISNPKVTYGVGVISHLEIDEINIYQATLQAMTKAIAALIVKPDLLLVDGMPFSKHEIPSETVIGGDAKSLSIAAASIIAKETRDLLMLDFHAQWPQYGFDRHKGYGTPQHLEAIRQHGPCPIHRMTFAPLKYTH